MEKHRRIILILGITLILILGVLYLLLSINKNPANNPSKISVTISPTHETSVLPTQEISPTPDDTGMSFTGYQEDSYTDEEINRISQTNALRELSPFDASYFVITFNYKILKFEVQLRGNPATSQDLFEQWLQKNYPAIPRDMFVIK